MLIAVSHTPLLDPTLSCFVCLDIPLPDYYRSTIVTRRPARMPAYPAYQARTYTLPSTGWSDATPYHSTTSFYTHAAPQLQLSSVTESAVDARWSAAQTAPIPSPVSKRVHELAPHSIQWQNFHWLAPTMEEKTDEQVVPQQNSMEKLKYASMLDTAVAASSSTPEPASQPTTPVLPTNNCTLQYMYNWTRSGNTTVLTFIHTPGAAQSVSVSATRFTYIAAPEQPLTLPMRRIDNITLSVSLPITTGDRYVFRFIVLDSAGVECMTHPDTFHATDIPAPVRPVPTPTTLPVSAPSYISGSNDLSSSTLSMSVPVPSALATPSSAAVVRSPAARGCPSLTYAVRVLPATNSRSPLLLFLSPQTPEWVDGMCWQQRKQTCSKHQNHMIHFQTNLLFRLLVRSLSFVSSLSSFTSDAKT